MNHGSDRELGPSLRPACLFFPSLIIKYQYCTSKGNARVFFFNIKKCKGIGKQFFFFFFLIWVSWSCKVIFLRFYLFIFRDRVREGEREGEKHQCVVVSQVPRTGNLACNPSMYPDWESNQKHFGSQPTLNPLSYTRADFWFF